MSQEYNNTIAKRPRRTRTPRNRPVLVTCNEADEEVTTEDLTLDTRDSEVTTDPIAPVATTRSPLRLPKFFSKVEHDKEDAPAKTDGIVEARMARAKKSLNGKAATTAVEVEPEVNTKSVAKTKPAPPKKPQLFKSRHIIGMALYLFGANLLLPYEGVFLKSAHLESNLFKIATFQVTSSIVLNVVTLVVFLYLLVAFDLIPSGKGVKNAQQKNGTKTTSTTQNTQNAQSRTPQPTIRQGVKGDSDDIYQSYRSKQRKRR
jgi:hypothetical protein